MHTSSYYAYYELVASTKIICMHTLVRAVDRSTTFTPSLRHPLSHFRVSPFLKDTVQKDSTCPQSALFPIKTSHFSRTFADTRQ